VCGSGRNRPYVRTWDRSHGQPGEFTFVACRGCGHVYLNPRPTQTEITAYYPETYKEYVGPVEHEASALVRANRAWGMRKRVRLFTSRMKPGRFLDVGCGSGALMAAMRDQGWEVHGEDTTPAAVRLAREHFGLDVFQGTLEEANYPDAHFDAVVLWNVIEHVPDPPATLREVARVTRPGGIVVMATPNVDSFEAHIFGSRWALWEAPRHFNVFSPRTMDRVLEQTGWRSLGHTSQIGTWFALATSVQYALEERRGWRPKPADPERVYWEGTAVAQLARLAAVPYTWLTDKLGEGSTMIVCAERVGS